MYLQTSRWEQGSACDSPLTCSFSIPCTPAYWRVSPKPSLPVFDTNREREDEING